MQRSKKSKVLTTVSAVALAASMIIGGGTFAYLQSESGDVVNEFKTNKVQVSLEETYSNQYDIIPGTEQDKDPAVTVDNTVDAYVYVRISDNTGGLVGYTVADGWLPLRGVADVYYRRVAADAENKTFYVLQDNKVYYSAELDNGDMLDESEALKTGLDLTFKAYAVQCEPFASALSAWMLSADTDAKASSNVSELSENLQNGGTVVLTDDIVVDSQTASNGAGNSKGFDLAEDTVLVLDGRNIVGKEGTAGDALFDVRSGAVLDVYGDEATQVDTSDMQYTFYAFSDSTINIYGGSYHGSAGGCIFASGSDITVNIYGGMFSCEEYRGVSYVLNKYDDYKDDITFTVYGGTFVNCDPSANNNEHPAENQVAEGYHVESSEQPNGDIWYTVVPDGE